MVAPMTPKKSNMISSMRMQFRWMRGLACQMAAMVAYLSGVVLEEFLSILAVAAVVVVAAVAAVRLRHHTVVVENLPDHPQRVVHRRHHRQILVAAESNTAGLARFPRRVRNTAHTSHVIMRHPLRERAEKITAKNAAITIIALRTMATLAVTAMATIALRTMATIATHALRATTVIRAVIIRTSDSKQ